MHDPRSLPWLGCCTLPGALMIEAHSVMPARIQSRLGSVVRHAGPARSCQGSEPARCLVKLSYTCAVAWVNSGVTIGPRTTLLFGSAHVRKTGERGAK